MRKLKTYNLFLESESYINALKTSDINEDYSILDWLEDLKSDKWSSSKVNINKHKPWCEHFIGEGWWDKITSHIDRIFEVLSDVDLKHINDAMLEVFDTIPEEKERVIYPSILYSSYDRIDDDTDYKYNGTMPIFNLKDTNRKISLFISLLIDIVYPTIGISGIREFKSFRNNDDELYVTDKKWQCQNFDFEQFYKTDVIKSWEWSKLKKYSPENVLSMYRPGVVISIGGWDSLMARESGPLYIEDLEKSIDEVIDVVTSDLDFEKVIWPYSRKERYFDTSLPVYDFDLKILLKM